MSIRKRAEYYAVSGISLFFLGMLFFRSLPFGFACALASLILEKIYAGFLVRRRQEKLLVGFKDALYSISGAVAAGRQMPYAIEFAASTALDAGGPLSDIYAELKTVSSAYKDTHSDIGLMLEDFGTRSGIPEIRQFAAAYRTCQLCGGDLEGVCRKSAELLIDRITFKEETHALISQKKLDIILLTAMPVAVLLILNLTNYSYVAVLYETAAGRVVMLLCLLLILSAMLWGIKITNIEI